MVTGQRLAKIVGSQVIHIQCFGHQSFRQAEITDLAFFYKVGHCANHLFYRYVGVDAVSIIEIDIEWQHPIYTYFCRSNDQLWKII